MTVTAIPLPHLTGYFRRQAAFQARIETANADLRAYLAQCQASNIHP